MPLLPFSGPPVSKRTVYSPADFVVAPKSAGRKADYYTDGVNDQVQINAAITAANALPDGGTVELWSGTYQIAAKVVPLSNVWLRGHSMSSTILQATSALTDGILDNKAVYDTADPYVNGIISDLELDGTNMNRTRELKGLNADTLNNCKIFRVYVHDTTATGLGADDFYGSTITECIVSNCGYMNTRTITAASWSSNTIVFTSNSHGYSINDVIVVTGMIPFTYNGRFVITAVTTNIFTVTSTFLDIDPGAATTFGISSDSLIGHNGIGIASGANTHEATIVTNNLCFGNQNNNFLIEADTTNTDANASYIFSNNISVQAGQSGYLNTGTPNVQFTNNYDYGSQFGCEVAPVTQVRTISAASWSGGIITFTLASGFTTTVNSEDTMDINGMTPDAYNGFYRVVTPISSTQFTVALASNPGTATVFGTATRVAHVTDNLLVENNIFTNNVLYGVRIVARSDKFKISGNIVFDCYNYGVAIGASYGNVTDNHIYANGRDGIDLETGGGTHTPITDVIISDNHIYNNGQRATYDGIEVQSAAAAAPVQDVVITDNRIYDYQSTKTQRYGIILRSGGTLMNFMVMNNDLAGNATAGLLRQNTAETIVVENNGGFDPDWYHALGSISGSVTINRIDGILQTATLTGSVTFTVTNGSSVGDLLRLELTQDSSGGHTASWSGNVKFAAGGLTLSIAANAVDTIAFYWDGTNWRELSRALATNSVGTLNNLVVTTPIAANVVSALITQNDTTNNLTALNSVNAGTGTDVLISQNGVLASNKYGLFVDSNAIQINSALARMRMQNASSTQATLQLDNAGSGHSLLVNTGDIQVANGNVSLGTAGNKVNIKAGSNASVGTGTLSGGTVTISTTAVTASSLIFLTDTSNGANLGILSVGTIVAATTFVVNSSNVLDAGTFNWLIIN